MLVEQTPVSGAFRVLCAHEAERSQSVVDGDDDQFLRGEHVTRLSLRRTTDEVTRMEPHQNRVLLVQAAIIRQLKRNYFSEIIN